MRSVCPGACFLQDLSPPPPPAPRSPGILLATLKKACLQSKRLASHIARGRGGAGRSKVRRCGGESLANHLHARWGSSFEFIIGMFLCQHMRRNVFKATALPEGQLPNYAITVRERLAHHAGCTRWWRGEAEGGARLGIRAASTAQGWVGRAGAEGGGMGVGRIAFTPHRRYTIRRAGHPRREGGRAKGEG